jgi:hypothetical protein
LLQLPASSLLWKYAPHLKFLQFPWRWLLALSVVGCVLAGMAALPGASRWRLVIAAVLIAVMAVGGGALFFQTCDEEDAVTPQLAAFLLGAGVEGTDEYTPVGADNTDVQQHLPLVRILRRAQDDTADSAQADNPEWHAPAAGALAARVEVQRANPEQWLVHIATPEAGFAVLRLMDYPSWRVTVDGAPAARRPTREDGLMAVPVGAGSHAVAVQWSATPDVIAGRALSAISLLALAVVAVRERRPHPNRRV